jgi:hypothetical protein
MIIADDLGSDPVAVRTALRRSEAPHNLGSIADRANAIIARQSGLADGACYICTHWNALTASPPTAACRSTIIPPNGSSARSQSVESADGIHRDGTRRDPQPTSHFGQRNQLGRRLSDGGECARFLGRCLAF